MATQFMDSCVYGGAWGTPELRAIFEEEARITQWLEILGVLAETEGEFGLVPADMAARVAAGCRAIKPDSSFLDEVRQGFEASGHSTQGLIQAVQKRCQGDSGEWLYCGATVQDLADTWMMGALRDARAIYARDLKETDAALQRLWPNGTAPQSWPGALTASKDYRSRSASRPRAGAPRSIATDSAS